MAEGGACNNQQPQEIASNGPLHNDVLNESSTLSDASIGSRSSVIQPKLQQPLTVNVTQELHDWEDDGIKRKVGTVLYPVVKKFLTAKMLQSEKNLHRFGSEMNELRTQRDRLSAQVWDLVAKLASAYAEIQKYKREANNRGKKNVAQDVSESVAQELELIAESAVNVLQEVSAGFPLLPARENGDHGNGENTVVDATNILKWSQGDDGKLKKDVQQQVDDADLRPGMANFEVKIEDSAMIPNGKRLNDTIAVAPDLKHPGVSCTADDSHYDGDETLVRSRSSIGNLERSGIGSVKVTTNLTEDADKSALAGEYCFVVDPNRSFVLPPELDSSDLQTAWQQAFELGSLYFSEEHRDVRLMSGIRITTFKVLPDVGSPIDIRTFIEAVRSKVLTLASQTDIHGNPNIPMNFLTSIAFIGIVDASESFVAITGKRVVYRHFEFLLGKHSLTLIKVLRTRELGQDLIDANIFQAGVARRANDILQGLVNKNSVCFDYKQLAESVKAWLKDSCQNVIVVCAQPSAIYIANGSALGNASASGRAVFCHRYQNEEIGFELYAWAF